MSTTSPVTVFSAAAPSFSLPCSSARASGAIASALAKAIVTTAFTKIELLLVELFIEQVPLNWREVNVRPALTIRLDQVRKLREEIIRVVRPRRRLGMILHAENRQLAMTHALHRAVV